MSSKLRIVQIELESAEGGASVELVCAALLRGLPPAPAPPEHAKIPSADAIVAAPAVPAEETRKHLAPPVPVRRGKYKKGKEKKHETRKALPAAPPTGVPTLRVAPGGGMSIASRILDALRKKPLSALELSEVLSLDPPQVYMPCKNLRDRALIHSKTDDAGDGTRRYFLGPETK